MATELENLVPEADVEVEGMRGPKGDKGDSYVLTEADKEEIAQKVDKIIDAETDKTLSISGKPADAKSAGDEINDLKADLSESGTKTEIVEYTLISDEWVTPAGIIQSHSTWSRTDYIDLTDITQFKVNFATNYASYFDTDKNPVAGLSIKRDTMNIVPSDVAYAMISQTTSNMNTMVITATKSGLLAQIKNKIAKIEEQIENIDIETDTTLSVSGKPADAKAVGDEINRISTGTFEAAFIKKNTSGNVATFDDGANVPIVSLIAEIAPVQSGSGDPSEENVRQISGFDNISIYHSGADTSVYSTIAENWESAVGTIYGGTFDAVSGILTITHERVDMSTLSWKKNTYNNIDYFTVVLSTAKPGVQNQTGKTYCDSYKTIASKGVVSAEFVDGTLFIQAAGTLYLRNSKYSTPEALKSSLAGKYLVYELKNYQIYQLTPHRITALVGENNFWHNCNGETTVTYCCDTETWVQGKIDKQKLLLDKKITLIGDSITAKTNRAKITHGMWLEEWTECNVQNLGISGTGFKRNTNYIYKNRISQINSDVDIIGVAASFNDMIYDLGTATDTITNDTVCGYANDFFDMLLETFPTKRIVCYSEGPWHNYHPGITKSDEYMALMKQICEAHGVMWDDSLYRGCALRPWMQANCNVYYVGEEGDLDGVVDNVHPNSEGQKVIARFLQSLFETVVD